MSQREHYFVVKAVMTPAGPEWAIDSDTAQAMFDGQLVWDPEGDGELGQGCWIAADDELELERNDTTMMIDLCRRIYDSE